MSLGISVIGPRKLPYLRGQDRSRHAFRFSKIEFETMPGVGHAVRLPYGIVLELQLADHVMVIGLARDLVSPQELDYVNMGAWGEYFTDCSTRDGLSGLLDAFAHVEVLRMKPETSYLELLEQHMPQPFYLHLPEPIDFCWLQDSHLTATMPYDAARERIRALLERFVTEPFLSLADIRTYARRLRAAQ